MPVTVILDPSVGAFVWLHMAPPIGDGLRRSYRKLLRWNDEFPFVKFSLAADDRPIAAVEIQPDRVDRDALGLAIARLLAICDLLLEETAEWIWIGGRVPPTAAVASSIPGRLCVLTPASISRAYSGGNARVCRAKASATGTILSL